MMFIGSIEALSTTPSKSPVEDIAAMYNAKKADYATSKLMQAKESYMFVIDESKIILAAGDKPDIFTIAIISKKFSRTDFIKVIEQIFTIKTLATDKEFGKSIYTYYLLNKDDKHKYGILRVQESSAAIVADTYTIGFMGQNSLDNIEASQS